MSLTVHVEDLDVEMLFQQVQQSAELMKSSFGEGFDFSRERKRYGDLEKAAKKNKKQKEEEAIAKAWEAARGWPEGTYAQTWGRKVQEILKK